MVSANIEWERSMAAPPFAYTWKSAATSFPEGVAPTLYLK